MQFEIYRIRRRAPYISFFLSVGTSIIFFWPYSEDLSIPLAQTDGFSLKTYLERWGLHVPVLMNSGKNDYVSKSKFN